MPPCTLQSPYLFQLPTNACTAWYGTLQIGNWLLLFTHTYNDIKERGAAEEKEKSERGGQAKAEAAKHPSFH